jgi:hypothetical protein
VSSQEEKKLVLQAVVIFVAMSFYGHQEESLAILNEAIFLGSRWLSISGVDF